MRTALPCSLAEADFRGGLPALRCRPAGCIAVGHVHVPGGASGALDEGSLHSGEGTQHEGIVSNCRTVRLGYQGTII